MHIHISGFSRWLMVKNLPTNAGDAGLRDPPEEGNGNPLEYYCLGNPKDRSLAGYSPWGCERVRHDLPTKQQQQHIHVCKTIYFV